MKQLDISQLDDLQKVGQTIMPRLDFNDPGSLTLAKKLVRDFGVGGFIIFGGDRKSVRDATGELQSISGIPLLFGCDAERGVGQILSDMTLFPFTMSLAAAADEELVYSEARYIAREMKECGLNLIFAPVLDVNTNPQNPIINIRSYGDDPALVSRMGTAFIKGCQDAGVPACAKHFPGHGSAGLDSHFELPVLHLSLEQLNNRDFIPFKEAIDSNVASFMTAHVAFPAICKSNIPATIAQEIIGGVLRDELGYEGVVFTDSFHMSGISRLGDEGDLSHLALKAGCDVILDPRDPSALLSRLNDMAFTGELNENLLNGAVKRIFSLKNSWLIDKRTDASPPVEDRNDIMDRIARSSVCLLKGGTLGAGKASVFVFDVTRSEKEISSSFTKGLRDAGIDFIKTSVTVTSPPPSIPDRGEEQGAVICLIYTTIGAWKKQSYLPEYFRDVLNQLSAVVQDETVLVSFGSPYVVHGLDNFDTVICAFDSLDACQTAAADVLTSELEARGRMPVRI